MFGSALKKSFIILLAAVICFTLASCKKEPPAPEIHTSDVIRSGKACIFEYGSFLYFSYDGIYRYNTLTGELSSACIDPECDGKCPLHGGMSRIGALEDGKLYFFAFQAFSHDILLGYQDIVSGEVKVLDTLSDKELSKDITFVNSGYFYYYAGILKEGGNAKDPADYESRLCRVPTSGGEREVLDSPIDTPQLVIDGKLLAYGSELSLYELETGEKRVLWDFKKDGFKLVRDFSYVDGRIYLIAEVPASDAEEMVSEYTGVVYTKHAFLISVDIATGEWKKLADEAVESFTVTNDRVYYYPTELRYLYVPDNYEKNPDGVYHSFFGSTLYSRKLDGSDLRAEYTNEAINTCYDYTVIDGRLYGSVSIFEESAKSAARAEFCALELASGSIIDREDFKK